MKLKTAVVAMIFGLSGTAAWAADPVQGADEVNQAQASGTSPSSGLGNASEDHAGWQYVNGQAVVAEAAGGGGQSANEENSSASDQAANLEEASDGDQAAISEDATDGDQSADAEDAGGNDQAADSVIRPGTFQPASLEDFKAATQDKLVVILPTGWQGSVPHLIAALEVDSDAAEILILSQDDDAADSQDESSDSQ